jgi:hypothetical protein
MKFKTLTFLGAAAWLSLAGSICFAQEGAKQRVIYGDSSMAPVANSVDNPDWAEEQNPQPPAFSVQRLIPLDMPSYLSIKFGVDPETIAVGGDGVVRYVIVMRNVTGSTSAVFEGVRCVSDEVKTYARFGSAGQWSMVAKPEWKPVNDNMPSHHAQAFARQGGCKDRFPPGKQDIIEALSARQRMAPSWKGN